VDLADFDVFNDLFTIYKPFKICFNMAACSKISRSFQQNAKEHLVAKPRILESWHYQIFSYNASS